MSDDDEPRGLRPEVLVLLDARRARAAVAWQYVERRSSPGPTGRWVEAWPGIWYCPDDWMALAGLRWVDHPHVAPFLFRADVVDADGGAAAEALVYARRMTATTLQRGRRER